MMRSTGPTEGLLGFSAEKYIPACVCVCVCGLVGAFALAPPVFLIGVHLYYVYGGGFLFFFVKYLNFFTVGCV